MFDGNNLLKDKAARYGTDRIALRLNTPLAQAFKDTVKRTLQCVAPFPGTQANILNVPDEPFLCLSVRATRYQRTGLYFC